MHLFKKYLNFSNKNIFVCWLLTLKMEPMYHNIVNSLDCPKGKAVLDWWESSQRFKRYINFSEISPIEVLL